MTLQVFTIKIETNSGPFTAGEIQDAINESLGAGSNCTMVSEVFAGQHVSTVLPLKVKRKK